MMVPMGGIGDGSDEDCLKILHQVELDLAGGQIATAKASFSGVIASMSGK